MNSHLLTKAVALIRPIKKLIIIIVLFNLMISCSKESEKDFPQKKSAFNLIENSELLNERIQYINKPIQLTNNKKDLGYVLVASIESPVINGQKLSATSVTGTFGRAYVGFHARGENIGGELLSLDISNQENPVILQSAQSENFEINDLYFSTHQPKLWICGDTDTDSESGNQAYAMEYDLDANLAHNEAENWIRLSSAGSGNSITETMIDNESHLWFTSGKEGGLEVFPSSNPQEVILSFDADNTKHFDADKQYGVVIIGIENNLSIVRVYDFYDQFSYTDYEIPYTLNSSAKHGIFVSKNKVYIAMGADGLLIMDITNGEIISTFKANGGIANSVFVEKDYIYLAYGNAGLFILDQRSLEYLGNYKYDGSCNFVYVDHGIVFLANGNGDGFLILKKN